MYVADLAKMGPFVGNLILSWVLCVCEVPVWKYNICRWWCM